MSELELVENGYKKYDIDYSICFLDLDHFKKVNDEFGHEAGDVILKTVGKILKKECGELDIVGRYGGEEFLVILPKRTLEEAVDFAKKACEDIEKFKFIYKTQRIMAEGQTRPPLQVSKTDREKRWGGVYNKLYYKVCHLNKQLN